MMDVLQEQPRVYREKRLWKPLRIGLRIFLVLAGVVLILGLTFNIWFPLLTSIPHTNAITLGDLDNDMDLDAFYTNGKSEESQPNTVLINQGGLQGGRPAGFKDSGQRLGEDLGNQVFLADLDGDRDLDALVSGTPGISEYMNIGYGYFEARLDWPTGIDGGWSLAVGDLDGDGDPDGLAAGFWEPFGPNLATWINQGGAQGGSPAIFFESKQRTPGLGAHAVALGDLDGDGDLDAFLGQFITHSDGEMISGQPNQVAWNDGTGVFSDSGQRLGSAMTVAVALGDLDGDGDLDAYSGNQGPDEIWLNTVGGQGRQPGLFVDSGQRLGDGEGYSRRVFLVDLNSDGYPDVVTEKQGKQFRPLSLEIRLNDGHGNFPTLNQRISHYRAQAFTLGDLDGDGDVDVFAGWYKHGYAIWWNRGDGIFSR